VEHRGIAFSVVEMAFPRSWKWTVGKRGTVTVGVCTSRQQAIRQAQTFIDAIMDWGSLSRRSGENPRRYARAPA
jgi:hypothetical protein